MIVAVASVLVVTFGGLPATAGDRCERVPDMSVWLMMTYNYHKGSLPAPPAYTEARFRFYVLVEPPDVRQQDIVEVERACGRNGFYRAVVEANAWLDRLQSGGRPGWLDEARHYGRLAQAEKTGEVQDHYIRVANLLLQRALER